MTAQRNTIGPEVDETEGTSVLGPRWLGALDRLASWRVWTASAVLFVPFAFVFFASSAAFSIPEVEAACGQVAPDMRFYSSGDDVVSFLDACGPAGRAAYQDMQLADLVYPLVVGLFLAASLALVISRLSSRSSLRWVPVIPLVAAVFDYLENTFAWLAIRSYPEAIVTNDVFGFASAAKTSLSWAAGLTLLTCLTVLGLRSVRRRMRRFLRHPNGETPRSIRQVVQTANHHASLTK